ncbi:MAG: hypothetical protein H7A36_06935 [Chlamydiales bacterium]|nr:hypothetical protein [Chlamydiales bacterium]
MRGILLWLLLLPAALFANTYFDVGAGTMPLTSKKKTTYMAVGKRFETYRGSVDLSAGHQISSKCQNYFGVKGIVTHNLTDNLYIGAGPGIGIFTESPNKWGTASAATIEGVVGFKLPETTRIKPDLQFGVTQPMHVFHNGTGHKLNKGPAFTLSLKLRY